MEEGAAAAAGRPTSHSARKIGNRQQGRRMEWGGEEPAYLDRSSRETRGRRRRPSDLTRREKRGKLDHIIKRSGLWNFQCYISKHESFDGIFPKFGSFNGMDPIFPEQNGEEQMQRTAWVGEVQGVPGSWTWTGPH